MIELGFWLKKTIGFWLMPLSLVVLLLTSGTALLWLNRRPILAKSLVSIGLVTLVLLSWNPITTPMLRSIEQTHEHFQLTSPVDYIVVLGNKVENDPDTPLSSHLSSSAKARILEGLRIANANPQAKLIVSGYASENSKSSAEVYRQVALSLGFDDQRIIALPKPMDTRQEAQAVKDLLNQTENHGALVALVTSASHMPRAANHFKQLGINIIPAPTFYLAKYTKETDWRFDSSGLLKAERSFYEWLGMAWHKITGLF